MPSQAASQAPPPDPTALEPVRLCAPAVRIERWSWPLVGASTLVGALGALAAALIRLGFRGLQWALTGSISDPPAAALHLAPWRRLLTPVLGALVATGILWLQRQRHRHAGPELRSYVEYVEAVRHRGGLIPLPPNGWRTLSAAWAVASGAAVGREGSMIQFAAAVASAAGRFRPSPAIRSLPLSFLVACGVAGGVTAAYNAPVAAVFFAAEIVLGGLAWRELPLLALAAAAGWLVSGALLGWTRLYPTPLSLHWSPAWCFLPLLALLFGLAGPAYPWLLGSLKALRRLPLALLWGGLVVGGLSLLDTRVWGNGDVGLRSALDTALPAAALLRLLLLRLLASLACVWTGTVGGVFTPTLFLGAALGALLGHALPSAPSSPLWAIAGMSLFLAAVTQAPLMAALMAVELTGNWLLLPVLVPLNFLAWWLASRLSRQAMYAIASQSPATTEPRTRRRPDPTGGTGAGGTVTRDGI